MGVKSRAVPNPLLLAAILGLVEGITEFLPVSSTGHLYLVGHWLGLEGEQERAFEIFIQLGAVLAIAWDFRGPLLTTARRAWREEPARRLLAGVLVAFFPAAVAGLAFHGLIEKYLFFKGPIALALIVGGLLILLVESLHLRPRTEELESVTWGQALAVGCAQVAALFPGFSRSAATILGGLVVGMSRPVATEFSFYLAIPTIAAASIYSLIEELPRLAGSDTPFFAIGLTASFLSAALVVRVFLAFVRRSTFRPFAWYRIAFGVVLFLLPGEGR